VRIHVGGVPWTRCVGVCIAVEAQLTVGPNIRRKRRKIFLRTRRGTTDYAKVIGKSYSLCPLLLILGLVKVKLDKI
jgi:hypothetical protein